MKWLLFLLVITAFSPLHALKVDPSTANYELRKKKRVDIFDFKGDYFHLENIDIDAKRKKRVEIYLTGNYPILETINYEASFGLIKGELTGEFPQVSSVNFTSHNANIQLDLTGTWAKSCTINIQGGKEPIELTLPKNVGVIVNTKTDPSGKVMVDGLKKKGRGIWKKTYHNELVEEALVVLTINVVTSKGHIILQ